MSNLDDSLRWRPWPIGDPPPPWLDRLIQELDRELQVEIARAQLDTMIAVAEARTTGLRKLQEVLARSSA